MKNSEATKAINWIINYKKEFVQGTEFSEIYEKFKKETPVYLRLDRRDFATLMHFQGFFKKIQAVKRDGKDTTTTVYYHDTELEISF